MELRQAIHEDAVEKGNVDDEEILLCFIAVSAWVKLEDDGKCVYVYHTDELKAHEAIGLLHMGIDAVMTDTETDD